MYKVWNIKHCVRIFYITVLSTTISKEQLIAIKCTITYHKRAVCKAQVPVTIDLQVVLGTREQLCQSTLNSLFIACHMIMMNSKAHHTFVAVVYLKTSPRDNIDLWIVCSFGET
jgi:hypothetical protein